MYLFPYNPSRLLHKELEVHIVCVALETWACNYTVVFLVIVCVYLKTGGILAWCSSSSLPLPISRSLASSNSFFSFWWLSIWNRIIERRWVCSFSSRAASSRCRHSSLTASSWHLCSSLATSSCHLGSSLSWNSLRKSRTPGLSISVWPSSSEGEAWEVCPPFFCRLAILSDYSTLLSWWET